jgi:hypothetical protein
VSANFVRHSLGVGLNEITVSWRLCLPRRIFASVEGTHAGTKRPISALPTAALNSLERERVLCARTSIL